MMAAPTTPRLAHTDNAPNNSLPPPDTFDITPSLHELLSRLLVQPGPPDSQSSFPKALPLEIQQLGSEVSEIRNRIRKARAAVDAMPDVERTVKDQEVEMDELREKIRAQREILSRMKK